MQFKWTYVKTIFYVSSILFGPSLFGQETKSLLSGKITDLSTGAALTSATVYIEELKIGAIADNKGEYKLELLHNTYTLAIRFSGYATQYKTITLNDNLVLDIRLLESPVNPDEVLVTGASDKNVGSLNIGLKSMKVEEIKALPKF